MSLKHRTANGFIWSFADNIANSGISFLVSLILARMLSPQEFGIIGMITLFIVISNAIIDSGFGVALIRKQDVKPVDYSTVFIFNLVISLILYFILFFSASFISSFFNEPQLFKITRVIGLVLIINAIALIHRTKLIKKIDFKTQAKISLISSIGSGIVGIGMAYKGFGVWSLVGLQISRQLLQTLFLIFYSRWKPILKFSKKSFRELFGFSVKVLMADMINTFYKNIFYVVIGKFYTATQLGYYTRAEQFNLVFTNNLTNVIQRVSFPVLSTMQGEADKMYYSFRKLVRCSAFLSFTGVSGLAAISTPLIIVLIGNAWVESAEYLKIISLYGILYPIQALNLNILNVKGRSDLLLKLEFFKKIVFIPVILIGFFFSLKIMLWSSVIYYFFEFFCNSFYSKRLVGYGTFQQIRDLLPIALFSLLISSLTFLISLLDISAVLVLLLQVFVFITLFFLICESLQIEEYCQIKDFIKSTFCKRK